MLIIMLGTEIGGEFSSYSPLFMMKVMVGHFVSTGSKVMTALILVIFSFSFTGTDTMVKPSKF